MFTARYRQQIDQAQSYYWHAAYLVPFNGEYEYMNFLNELVGCGLVVECQTPNPAVLVSQFIFPARQLNPRVVFMSKKHVTPICTGKYPGSAGFVSAIC